MYLFIANAARRVMEWAERRSDRRERHVIDMMRDAWVSK